MFDTLFSAVNELEKKDEKLSQSYKEFQIQYQKFNEDMLKELKTQHNSQMYGLPYKKS